MPGARSGTNADACSDELGVGTWIRPRCAPCLGCWPATVRLAWLPPDERNALVSPKGFGSPLTLLRGWVRLGKLPCKVAITGATGYLGRTVTASLSHRGHYVRALIRPGSRHRVAAGAEAQELDLFDINALARGLEGCDTVVHLVGTSHP